MGALVALSGFAFRCPLLVGFPLAGFVAKMFYSSTKLQATKAIQERLDTFKIQRPVWRFSDNLQGIRKLQQHSMEEGRASIAKNIVAMDAVLAGRLNVGWCPCEHDTKGKDALSISNRLADGRAGQVVDGSKEVQEWITPQSWCDGDTMHMFQKGVIVGDIKRAMYALFQWPLDREAFSPVNLPG